MGIYCIVCLIKTSNKVEVHYCPDANIILHQSIFKNILDIFYTCLDSNSIMCTYIYNIVNAHKDVCLCELINGIFPLRFF